MKEKLKKRISQATSQTCEYAGWERLLKQELQILLLQGNGLKVSKMKKILVNTFLITLVHLIFLAAKTRKLFLRKHLFPTIIVFSLTEEQLQNFPTQNHVAAFFGSDRFGFTKNANEYLFERPTAFTFRNQGYSTTNIAALHLFLNFATKEEIRNIWREFQKLRIKLSKYDNRIQLPIKTRFRLTFEYSIWFILSRSNALTLVTTQTHLKKSPTAFFVEDRNLTKVMLWYSSNFRQFQIPESEYDIDAFGSNLRENYNMHFVWAPEDVDYLKQKGVHQVTAVGSIVFQEPEKRIHVASRRTITYFDVTPYLNSTDIYSSENSILTLDSIIKVCKNLETQLQESIVINLKPKREYKKSHSSKYLNYLAGLEKGNQIKSIRPIENIYKLISSSRVVICFPFTSPALIAKELEVPVIYLLISKNKEILPSEMHGIPLVTDTVELRKFLEKYLT